MHRADAPADELAAKVIAIAADQGEWAWDQLNLDEGCFIVRAQLEVGGQVFQTHETGFYVLSDERARRIAGGAPRLAVRPDIAPDYCVADGKPFPMTGSTYMARDNYRDCLGDLNVALARSDMASLRQAGVNILRVGIWTTYRLIYEDSGGFREQALRSMDAYFLCAAEAGLPVQFAPSAFVMNCWDREGSPFHDPPLRSKAMKCFEQFAQRYADWPGVQLDMINEPSYAPFKHGYLWQLARPFEGENELRAWQRWLYERYQGDISSLRSAWGTTADDLPSFDAAAMPAADELITHYDGPKWYNLRTKTTDFYAFADDAFSDWVREIREIVQTSAPRMLTMIGRDETLRVPTQQRDAFEGNIDVVNWHQWHREGAIFNEYCLNRVRGMVCCGQEMGILCYKDQRNDERLDEYQMRDQLERKLIYCLGNWIQWQSHSDPTMDTYVETKLGLLRADGTERPATGVVRLLSWLEAAMADRLTGRREDLERLAIVAPTSLWFSSDSPLAYRASMHAIIATHYHLKQPAYMVLESLLREDNGGQIGEPAAMILPSPTVLSTRAWRVLLDRVRHDGMTLLVTGSPEQDEHWRPCSRLADLGIDVQVGNLATVERLRLGDRTHGCTFRDALRMALPGKALRRAVPDGSAVATLTEITHGKGRVVYCPVPVELADGIEATVDLYRQVLKTVSDLPPAPVETAAADDSAAQFVYGIRYESCTSISLVNEGTDAVFRFRLTDCNRTVEANLAKGRAAKLYVDQSGHLIGGYIHDRVKVGETEIIPGGDLSFVRREERWHLLPGQRTRGACVINGRSVETTPYVWGSFT